MKQTSSGCWRIDATDIQMTDNDKNNRPSASRAELSTDGLLAITLSGDWDVGKQHPVAKEIVDQVTRAKSISFECQELGGWDTSLVTYLVNIVDAADAGGKTVDRSGLPDGVQGLLKLAYAVAERAGARREDKRESFLTRVGKRAQDTLEGWLSGLEFIGSSTMALIRFLTGRAQYQKSEFWIIIQAVGPAALGIVGLINFLVGMILAFVGAVQLQAFGAGIYVADLVGIAMTREMAAIMTAIIMAGRTGAAFAAQLGTMRVNEEIDALTTMGIDPMEFLVVPRMLALMVMMPLLVFYADLAGIFGGLVVGVGGLNLGLVEYLSRTINAVSLTQIFIGVSKAVVFGAMVAVAGCLRGMQCGNSSQAVGLAATSAVVTSIVLIIVGDGLFAVILNVFGI
jgi:phospholipid/cholesterol/gamma-HCH transport system permease protein